MREEYLLWKSLEDCKEFSSFEAAQKAAIERKGGCVEVLKIAGNGTIIDRFAVWCYKSGFITTNPSK